MELPDFLIIPSDILEDSNLTPLDGYVYGLVYWYTKLKLEKCIASNAQIARMLGASPSGVSHSLTKLSRKGFIKVILDDFNQRKEIVPLISFNTPTQRPATPIAETSYPPSSDELHNNIDLIRTNTYKSELDTFIEKFNEKLGTKFRQTPELYSKFTARRKTFSLEDLIEAMVNMLKDPFYKGENERKWRATPEYILRHDEHVQRFLNARGQGKEFDPDDPGKTFRPYSDIEQLVKDKKI